MKTLELKKYVDSKSIERINHSIIKFCQKMDKLTETDYITLQKSAKKTRQIEIVNPSDAKLITLILQNT